MPDRRRALHLLCAASLVLFAAACRSGSAGEAKMRRYVVTVSGMS